MLEYYLQYVPAKLVQKVSYQPSGKIVYMHLSYTLYLVFTTMSLFNQRYKPHAGILFNDEYMQRPDSGVYTCET